MPARAQRIVFLSAGLAVTAAALCPPVHRMAETLLTAHMIQHLALVLVASPLLAAARPLITIVRALPRPARRLVARLAAAVPARRRLGAALRHPGGVWAAHACVLWAWHMPWLYDRAVDSAALHAVEHASFMATGVAFWSVLVRPRERRRLGVGGGLVYLFTAAIQSTVLGALLALAERPWYAAHAGGLSPLHDQHVAGLIMWIPAGCVYLAAILALVASWVMPSADHRSAPVHGRKLAGTARRSAPRERRPA
jgi:cytochrome c oxidase assembly factor CtaG